MRTDETVNASDTVTQLQADSRRYRGKVEEIGRQLYYLSRVLDQHDRRLHQIEQAKQS